MHRKQGSTKSLSGHPGQVDVPAGKATFLTYLSTLQSPRQATFQSDPKGQAGFQICFLDLLIFVIYNVMSIYYVYLFNGQQVHSYLSFFCQLKGKN